jgi:hypothetical protein
MSAPETIEVAVQRRRLATMLAINLLCVVVGGVAAFGALAHHILWMAFVFVGALVIGFAAHVWLMLGLAHGAGRRESA